MCMVASVCTNYVHGYVSKTTILRVSLADSDLRGPLPLSPRVGRGGRRNPRFLFNRNRAAAKSGYTALVPLLCHL